MPRRKSRFRSVAPPAGANPWAPWYIFKGLWADPKTWTTNQWVTVGVAVGLLGMVLLSATTGSASTAAQAYGGTGTYYGGGGGGSSWYGILMFGTACAMAAYYFAVKWLPKDLARGDRGFRGPIGKDGLVGPVGPKGAKGCKGGDGPVGPKGSAGTGEKGQKGIKGSVGDKGGIGPIGDKGAFGPVGDKGVNGPVGDKGNKGAAAKGDKGSQGVKGSKGCRGLKGEIGSPFCASLTGTETDTSSLIPADFIHGEFTEDCYRIWGIQTFDTTGGGNAFAIVPDGLPPAKTLDADNSVGTAAFCNLSASSHDPARHRQGIVVVDTTSGDPVITVQACGKLDHCVDYRVVFHLDGGLEDVI